MPVHLLCLLHLVSLVEITIKVDESECLSMASCHDQETERFLSTGTTGRRVSFNEAALLDHGKKTQEKGRRSDSQHICCLIKVLITLHHLRCGRSHLKSLFSCYTFLVKQKFVLLILQKNLFCGVQGQIQSRVALLC